MAMCKVSSTVHFVTRSAGGREGSARAHWVPNTDVYATENACASIAKILHYCNSKVQNPQEVVQAWVETLPVVNDEEAAPYAYAFLAQLIEQYVFIAIPF